MTNTKTIDDFAKIDLQAAKRIKPVREDQRYINALEEVQELEGKLAKVKEQIENFSTKTIQDEAQRYLSGESDQKSETKEDLVHRCRVLEKAIEVTREKVRKIESNIIQEECEQIKDIATQYEEQTLKALEDFEKALRRQRLLYSYLDSKGFRQECRPAHWRVTDAENQFLIGYAPFGPPDEYIKQRKQFWGLKGD